MSIALIKDNFWIRVWLGFLAIELPDVVFGSWSLALFSGGGMLSFLTAALTE